MGSRAERSDPKAAPTIEERPGRPAQWSKMLSWVWEIRDKDLRFHGSESAVILPLVVIRRFDLVLLPTKAAVLAKASKLRGSLDTHFELLAHAAGEQFYNTSKFTFDTLVEQDPDNILPNTLDYLNAFSPNVRNIIDRFGLPPKIEYLAEAGILLRVLGKIASPKLDLSPAALTNMEMGSLYEELVRQAADLANKNEGAHFTPREVIALMVELLVEDASDLRKPGKVFTVYDPACGTGGMLTEAERHLLEINPKGKVHLFGEEIALKSHAICTSDMLIQGHDASRILSKDTLNQDGFPGQRFDYVLANPPYGVDWTESEKAVRKEHERGASGRFAAGLPAKSDGQLLFLQHMVAKAKTREEGGGRIAVVLNGSPLYVGEPGLGESNIRKWLFENDLVEAIIGLPDQLFYNTGINTYVWILSTSKRANRQGLVQLIDARDLFRRMEASLGKKRNELSPGQIAEIVGLYKSLTESPRSRILSTEDLGVRKVTIERPVLVSFRSSPDSRAALRANKAISKVESKSRSALLEAIDGDGDWQSLDQDEVLLRVDKWLATIGRSTKTLREALFKSVTQLDAAGVVLRDAAGNPRPDARLRGAEYLTLGTEVEDFIATQVTTFYPDAWADRSKDKIGYEVPFARCFHQSQIVRSVDAIDEDLRASQERIADLSRSDAWVDLEVGAERGLTERSPVVRLKDVAQVELSNVDKKTEVDEIPVRLCNYVDVYNHDLITGALDFMEASASEEQIARLTLRAGDVILTKDSESPDDIAVPAYVPETLDGVVCGYHLAVARARPEYMLGKYLFWVLKSQAIRDQCSVAANGVTRYGLSLPAIGALRFPLPSIERQAELVERLDRAHERMKSLSHELTRTGALIEERKLAAVSSTLGPVDEEAYG